MQRDELVKRLEALIWRAKQSGGSAVVMEDALVELRAELTRLRAQVPEVPWQVQLADALECFWNPAIEGSGDDRSNVIGGMVQGMAAVAYRLREHAAAPTPQKGVENPCRCIDCGGAEPGHSDDCTYMKELHGHD